MLEPRPLASLGVLSAAPFAPRRAGVRATWLSGDFAETASGVILARFVLAVGPDTSPAVKLALATEQAEHQDLLLIPSNHTSRAFTPLLVTFRWFMLATSEPPYREAQFIAKLDDDVYLHVPEFASHLQLLAERRWRLVYYGKFYHTIYLPRLFMHAAGGTQAFTVKRHAWARGGACHAFKNFSNCTPPFQHTTGSCQLLSSELATRLVSTSRVLESIDDAARFASGLSDETAQRVRRGVAYEDVWLGYAISNLVRPALESGATIFQVHLDAGRGGDSGSYYFDAGGWRQSNTTMLMHNQKKDARRLVAAHSAARQHCLSNASLRCHDESGECKINPRLPQNGSCSVRRNLLQTCAWSRVPNALNGTECQSGRQGYLPAT